MAMLSHGFTTREEWKNFFDNYFQRIYEIDDFIYTVSKDDADFEHWFIAYKKRSEIIHDLYLKNDKYLERHVHYFLNKKNTWVQEVADALLFYMFRYCTRFQDVEAAYKIASSLLEYYEKNGNEKAIMKCCFVLITCYAFLDSIHFRDSILQLCKRGISLYEKHYDELSEEEKSMGLSLYDFESIGMYEFLRPDSKLSHTFDTVLYPAYKKRMYAIKRFMNEADMEMECNKVLPYMKKCWISAFSSIIVKIHKGELNEKQVHKIYEIILKQYEEEITDHAAKGNIINECILHMCEYHKELIDDEFLYEYIKEKLYILPDKKVFSIEDFDDELLNVLTLFSCMIIVLQVNKTKKVYLAEELLHRLANICSMRQKNNYLEHAIDLAIYNYVVPLLKYCHNDESMFLNFLSFTVLRQIQTAIHSIMVSKLAGTMLSDILKQKPEVIAEALHLDTQFVKQHKNEMLEYVKKAALLHDTGKIICTTVINMQYRKLIDIEFKTIQYHPVTSAEILQTIPELSCFSDIAQGHHKSYDGTYGYPEAFNNVNSPQKIFLDLISLCDSLDAATDIYGRNYVTPKEFITVLQEFKAGMGTRYSPFLVNFLTVNTDLQKKLKVILETGRRDAYRFVYDLSTKKYLNISDYLNTHK